jgi:hypothetical protein
MGMPTDIADLVQQLDAAERDARLLVNGLSPDGAIWRPAPGSWSVSECLDHIAKSNSLYLNSMREPADKARKQGRQRRGPAKPGLIGGWFAKSLEPPVKTRLPAPRKVRPAETPAIADSFARFSASHNGVLAFLVAYADLDLTGVGFPNPFVPGIRFSLATGLHVLAAHERRHLWQAWRVRHACEKTATSTTR